jgi:acetyltransferase-like isoleucine patch superfamily enzyme
MRPGDVVQRVMFDYEAMAPEEIVTVCEGLPRKVLRWVAGHHPDNRTRLLFYELTGVPVGAGTVINPNVLLYDEYRGLVKFGERVSVASGVALIAASGPNNSRLAEHPYVRANLLQTAPITVEDDAWLGANAVVLPGVTIGAGAIVGAGAVVAEDVPAHAIVAGVPARALRSLE